jgi:hypothetical protein
MGVEDANLTIFLDWFHMIHKVHKIKIKQPFLVGCKTRESRKILPTLTPSLRLNYRGCPPLLLQWGILKPPTIWVHEK